jgi:hypothetical protein
MIERLQRALEHIDELSPTAQDDLAQFIEEMTEPTMHVPDARVGSPDEIVPLSVQRALALAGAWRNLQNDDEFAFFERMKHESTPSQPMDEQLAWLDEEDTE